MWDELGDWVGIYILLSIKWTGMDEFTTDDHTTVGRNPLEEME